MNNIKESEVVQWNIENTIKLIAEEDFEKSNIHEPNYLFTANIRFSDNFWDFTHLDKVHNKPHLYKFDFSKIDSTVLRVVLKKVVIREIYMRNNKISTVKKVAFNQINRLLKYLIDDKLITEPELITPIIIKQYIEKNYKHVQPKTLQWFFTGLKKFLDELEFGGFDLDYKAFETVLSSVDKRKVEAEKEANKTPNIPKDVFGRIGSLAFKDMVDDTLNYPQRIMACLILILSETGMRGGEACLLEAGRLKEISILNNSKKVYYLEFFTYKTTAEKDGRWTETIANEKVIKAYRELEKLTKEVRIKFQTSSLVINEKTGNRYTYNFITRNNDIFCYRHQNDLGFNLLSPFQLTQVVKKELDKPTKKNSVYYKQEDINKHYFIINPHQFRVAVANQLKDRGVQLQWIRRHMNHLEEDMTKHYFRDDVMKEALFVRASVDGNNLSPDITTAKPELIKELEEPELIKAYETINKFLKKKRLNIYKDIDDIILILKNNPLRETSVGICAKAMGTICERQERLATLERWYYISPQVPHISSLDFSYKRFISKAKIVDHNKKIKDQNPHYQRQYELEYKALQKFYKNCFYIEFQMFLKRIEEDGEEEVILSFPHLSKMIMERDEIQKEVQLWKMKLGLEI